MSNHKFTNWRKSRRSDSSGNCVEVATATNWRKSRSNSSANCVGVATAERAVGVRDSKQWGRGPVLAFTAAEWEAFVQGAKNGEFDL